MARVVHEHAQLHEFIVNDDAGSGAGCGEHWPLCNGVAVPQSPQIATIIEFVHRLTSGLAVGLALGLVVFGFQLFPRRHLVRRAAVAAGFFEFMEALLGAALVLLGHVAKDPSVARGYYLSAHLVNTLMLLAALTLAAWASGRSPVRIRSGAFGWKFAFGMVGAGLLLLGVSGVIAALGDTLFKSSSLSQGFRQDLLPAAHPFIRLRVWHPVIAVLVSLSIEALCFAARAKQIAWILGALTLTQIAAGMINLALLAPVPLQIFHLLLADDPDTFAIACGRLLGEPELRKRLVDAAEQLYREHYERSIARERIHALAMELCVHEAGRR